MAEIDNEVGVHRRARGLTQAALAERAGISRQALAAIEAGRSVPSTAVALHLARALGCAVERLFCLASPRLVAHTGAIEPGARVVLGQVAGQWVAHPLAPTSPEAADGFVVAAGSVEATAELERLHQTVLVAGCAPVLGALASHLAHTGDGGARWLHHTSGAALGALARGRTHVAGLHLAAADAPQDHDRLVREQLPGVALDIVGLVGWREGLAVAPGNPLQIRGAEDLARTGLRVGRRPAGSGAAQVLDRALAAAGLSEGSLSGRSVASHLEAARAILHGAVDAAVVIEPVAAAFGLPFLPLSEERFELVLRSRDRDHVGVARLLDQLTSARFVREVRAMGAYDTAAMGELRHVEAA